MSASRWVFPAGAVLTVGGVLLCALLEWRSFGHTQDWVFAILSQAFLPSLLLGAVLVIWGSFLDRKRLSAIQTKVRGKLCWTASCIALLFFITTGNVHSWTFTYILLAFVGFVTGAVLFSKPPESDGSPASSATRNP